MAATKKQISNLNPIEKGEVRNPNGRPKGSKNTRTILERFLNLEMKQKNPFTQEIESMSVLELMNLKQIANALEGDLASYKEVIDRLEGKLAIQNKTEHSGEIKGTTTTINVEIVPPLDDED